MINKINKLSQSKFINTFGNIFENAVWIAEDLYKKKPFTDFEDLSYKMIAIFENASKEAQLKILNDHPDLGNKAKISSLTIDSLKEQTNVGLNNCTKEECSHCCENAWWIGRTTPTSRDFWSPDCSPTMLDGRRSRRL